MMIMRPKNENKSLECTDVKGMDVTPAPFTLILSVFF